MPDTTTDEPFGFSYVLRQVAEDVRSMSSKLDSFATKAETAYLAAKIEGFMPKSEIDSKFKERDDRNERRMTEIMSAIEKLAQQMPSKEKVESLEQRLEQGPIAQWLLPSIATLLAIASAIFSFMHGGTH